MTNLTKTSGKSTYTEQLDSIRQKAFDELKQLVNEHGFMYSFDRGNMQKTDLISEDCEETIAGRAFDYGDYPIAIALHTEMRSEWFVLRSNKNKRRIEVAIDATDDLCIFADYLRAKHEPFNLLKRLSYENESNYTI